MAEKGLCVFSSGANVTLRVWECEQCVDVWVGWWSRIFASFQGASNLPEMGLVTLAKCMC